MEIYNDNQAIFLSIHNLGVYLGYSYDEFENIVIYTENLVEYDEDGTMQFLQDKYTERWFNQFGLSKVYIVASGEIEETLI